MYACKFGPRRKWSGQNPTACYGQTVIPMDRGACIDGTVRCSTAIWLHGPRTSTTCLSKRPAWRSRHQFIFYGYGFVHACVTYCWASACCDTKTMVHTATATATTTQHLQAADIAITAATSGLTSAATCSIKPNASWR